MRTFQLKINFNHIGGEIEKDYFKYRDLFYRCLVVNIHFYHLFHGSILGNTIMEDSHYNQYMLHLTSKGGDIQSMIKDIDITHNHSLFLDTQIYIEEFIKLKHDPNKINLYQLTIDDTYNIVITNKHLKRHVV